MQEGGKCQQFIHHHSVRNNNFSLPSDLRSMEVPPPQLDWKLQDLQGQTKNEQTNVRNKFVIWQAWNSTIKLTFDLPSANKTKMWPPNIIFYMHRFKTIDCPAVKIKAQYERQKKRITLIVTVSNTTIKLTHCRILIQRRLPSSSRSFHQYHQQLCILISLRRSKWLEFLLATQ